MTGNKKRDEEEIEKAKKKLMDYATTLNKVQAIRFLNKQEPHSKWIVVQTKTMVSWYK